MRAMEPGELSGPGDPGELSGPGDPGGRGASPTLPGKYGPGGDPLPAAVAAARLEAYERVARAAAGPVRAPVFNLSDEHLAALYAPRALEQLITRPLSRPAPACAAPAGPPAPP